ncbi:MAG: hypothetical protein IKQ69_10685 [Oscillospiraceae bacterium]|nr:hypothetical protein [Oscillospiraceae bacterium]MBR6209453.1 hypothetical protein [Oscillospiraceae bacterium]
MGRIWRWVAILCAILLILGLAMIAVAYASGSSLERLRETTDVLDMTKFIPRERLQQILTFFLGE